MKKAYKTIMSVLTVMTVAAGVVNTAPLLSDRYSVAAVAESEVVRGQFEGGASYRFIPGTGALILEGEGTFTAAEFEKTAEAYGVNFVVLDRKVKLPANTAVLPYNEWLYNATQKAAAHPVCAYAGSPSWIKYQEMINYLAADAASRGEGKSRKDFMDEFVLTTLSDKSGFFDSGVTYCYNEETGGLIFDGKGELSEKDFAKAFRSFHADFMFFGNDVTLECDCGARYVAFFSTLVQNWYNVVERPLIPTFTYEDSEYTKQFDEYLKEINTNGANYQYYTVEDGTDPYTFVNPLEPIPEYIHRGGLLWKDDMTGTSPVWSVSGTEHNSVLAIVSIHGASYTLDDVLKIAKDYNPTKICLGSDMTVLPAELQEFETIEEAEAYLLKLINDSKKTESVEIDISNQVKVDVQEDETEVSETVEKTESEEVEAKSM